MNNRGRLVLVVLFFGGLTALWVAEALHVPTSQQRIAMRSRVLPELTDVAVTDVGRVEVSGGGQTIILKREDRDWRLVGPVDARADKSTVDLLIEAMKDLRKPPDGEPLKGDLKTFGLDPPERVVTLFGKDGKTPLATLELGKEYGANRYVRAKGAESAEMGEALLLKAVDLPANGWRDRLLFDLASFEVTGFSAKGDGETVAAEREDQAWMLTEPVRAPGDMLKLEGLLGGLTSIRVVEGNAAYAANDAKDLKPYGLDRPTWTISLDGRHGTQTVEIGKPVEDDPGRFYARRVPEDDVVVVHGQVVQDLENDPRLLRSKRVALLNPSKVDYVMVQADGVEHRMVRTEEGWKLESPVKAEADARRVENLISSLNGLQVVEFFEPDQLPHSGLEQPEAVISVWQSVPKVSGNPTENEPALRLELGSRNGVGRILYARADGDPAILGLPIDVLQEPFSDRFAFVEHRLTDDPAGRTRSIERTRPAPSERVEASENSADYASWRLVEPVEAKADRESVAMLDHLLNPLTADRLFEREGTPELAKYGLDDPWARITWTTRDEKGRETRRVLRLGDEVQEGSGARYATIEGGPTVFSLSEIAVKVATVEMHERRVLEFAPASVSRLVIRRPTSEKVFRHSTKPFTGGLEWTPAPGTVPEDVDVSKLDQLVAAISALRVERFSQFEGPFPSEAGLEAPSLTVEVALRSGQGTRRLRIGSRSDGQHRYATVENGGEGMVFLVPDGPQTPWASLLDGSSSASEALPKLPADPFAPGSD